MTPASRILSTVVLAVPLLSVTSIAQQTEVPNAPQPQWKTVQTLSIGTPIIVRSGSSHTTCKFKNATDTILSCINNSEVDLQRNSIRSVETYNRPASTALFAALGAGIGIMMVQVVNLAMGGRSGDVKGAVYAGGAGMGSIIFFPIGYFTHPIHRTIYNER